MSKNLNHIEYIEYTDKENTNNSNNYGCDLYEDEDDNEYEYNNDLYLSLEKQKNDEKDNISDNLSDNIEYSETHSNIEPESEIQPAIRPVIHSEDNQKKYFKDKLLNTITENPGNTEDSIENLNYNVTFKILNASDFGLPQNRERIFIIGTKKG